MRSSPDGLSPIVIPDPKVRANLQSKSGGAAAAAVATPHSHRAVRYFGSAVPLPSAPVAIFDQLEVALRTSLFPARGSRELAFGACDASNHRVWGRAGGVTRAPRRQWCPDGRGGGAFALVDLSALLAEQISAAFRTAVEGLLTPLGACSVPLYDVDDTRSWSACSGVLIYRRRYLRCLCGGAESTESEAQAAQLAAGAEWRQHMRLVHVHLLDASVLRAPLAIRADLAVSARRSRKSASATSLAAAARAVATASKRKTAAPRQRNDSGSSASAGTVRDGALSPPSCSSISLSFSSRAPPPHVTAPFIFRHHPTHRRHVALAKERCLARRCSAPRGSRRTSWRRHARRTRAYRCSVEAADGAKVFLLINKSHHVIIAYSAKP
tara:strand:+ start:1748 stop:2893 length:1146 start_codon:yes stop_codon:yes gene_type:complete